MGRIFGMLLASIIIGPIIGVIARLLIPGRQNITVLKTIGVGIAAAFIGGVIALLFKVDSTSGIDWWQWAIQIALGVIGVGIVAAGGKKA
ncbi:GlsB/YeaQ/YmgE family stress response membrane protein [Longispora sp. NPDC051575]|uniref:GlsB/YeaQ/YmgE family stress response membrane protein n=1 Tax=Longispora sp. NPDC051575 TaxID=3154943 RepID=UPI00342BCE03